MYKFSSILACLIILMHLGMQAQHQEVSEKPEIWKGKKSKVDIDSTSILSAFKRGHFSGHFRYFAMATDNENKLSDYYANAIGGGLKFETATFHHLQFGVSGFYIFNIGSSDFTKADSLTGQMNRYELALFEIPNPTNKMNIDRLEELYLKYNFGASHITLGKQLINTPFINLQDGRMRPTEVQGIWAEIKQLKNTKFEGGLLTKISPRSTLEYYTIGESIGLYPQGVNPEGGKSNYKNNIESKAIGVVGITDQSIEGMSIQAWNQWVHNVFNTSMVQIDYKESISAKSSLLLGVQSIFQTAIQDGGHETATKTYITKGAKSFTFGARVGIKKSRLEASLNYNRITAMGRYLMPREWGRDPFFTFMPRERNEGNGDVHAFVAKANYTFPKLKLKTNIALGHFNLPSVTNTVLNKYGMPSYTQLNVDVRREFGGFLKGMEAQLLAVHKFDASQTKDPKNIINKVNMTNLNAIVNFHF